MRIVNVTPRLRQGLQEMFDILGAGYITTAVLKQILHEIDDTLTNDDLDGMINEIDEDGSGTVDFDGEQIDQIPLNMV